MIEFERSIIDEKIYRILKNYSYKSHAYWINYTIIIQTNEPENLYLITRNIDLNISFVIIDLEYHESY